MHKKTSAPLAPWPQHHYLSKPRGGGGGGGGCRIQGPGPAAPPWLGPKRGHKGGGSKTCFSKSNPTPPPRMPKQVFLARGEPVVSCVEPPKISKSLGPFWYQNYVHKWWKMCFCTTDPEPLGMHTTVSACSQPWLALSLQASQKNLGMGHFGSKTGSKSGQKTPKLTPQAQSEPAEPILPIEKSQGALTKRRPDCKEEASLSVRERAPQIAHGHTMS